MTLKDARALRDYIHSKYSINCTVPLGNGPDHYFPQSIMGDGKPRDWQSKQEFRDWLAARRRRDRKATREYTAFMEMCNGRRRSPIEMMIDRACGFS